MPIPYRELGELEDEELSEYTSVSWQVILYVAVGTTLGLLFDQLGIFGFLAEGVVRAIAGTADTLGLAFAALTVLLIGRARRRWTWARNAFSDPQNPKAITWIKGGLIGLGASFLLQGIVFTFSDDPHGPVGVIYAFGFSNLDNTFAGISVLIAALANHGREGWSRYWRHPFFAGNAFMLVVIPIVSLVVRLLTGFRPELNTAAGLEAGLMDVDSVGAAIIFLVATKRFGVRVPYIDDSLTKSKRLLGRLILPR